MIYLNSRVRVIIIFYILITCSHLCAQSADSSLAYFPMHIGNKWEYYGYMISSTPYYSLTVEITGDTLASNGFRYMIFEERKKMTINASVISTIYWKRLDSLSGSIYEWDPANSIEFQEDSLRAMPGDSFNGYMNYKKWCLSIKIDTILGFRTLVKSFYGVIYDPTYKLALGLGLCNWYLDDGNSLGLEIRYMIYARINGIEYGTPLSVGNPEIIPKRCFLNQNYPNPFNPSTNFRFSIANPQLTILKVYDVLGREVATLVNEVKQPGEYTATWDASNISSGVYFYRLIAGQFIETKKLVLLK